MVNRLIKQVLLRLVFPTCLALVLGEIDFDIRLRAVFREVDFLLRLALVLGKVPDSLIVRGLRTVLGLIDDEVRLGAVFGHIHLHVGLGLVVSGIDLLRLETADPQQQEKKQDECPFFHICMVLMNNR